jgi:kynureninase
LTALSREEARELDERDPLRPFRDRFQLPEDIIYLDGNSLGALPKATLGRQRALLVDEWGESLIRSWNCHDWIGAPRRVGAKLAPLIGAGEDEVLVADSTSVNLFKLLVAAARRSDRKVLLSEAGNFHTDLHIAAGVADLLNLELAIVAREEIEGRIDESVNLILLTHVHYKTGERFDLERLTAKAKAAGASLVWDLSHSAGAVPLALGAAGVELAVGCGYKYLNGGPGAPAFLYVARALQEALVSPVTGWMGHAAPFAFTDDYRPAPGIDRFLAGTPSIIGIAALESGIDSFAGVDMEQVWAKSIALFEAMRGLVAARCPELECVSPDAPKARGSHISFRHSGAFAICQALIADGVIGDFREPDILRFGLTPLYLGFEDVWIAAERLAAIMAAGRWTDPAFQVRGRVT